MGAVTWTTPAAVSAATIGISGVTVNAAAGYKGSEYDNETNLYRWGTFQLNFQHGTGPSTGVWKLYLVLDPTHGSYEDGDTGVQPGKVPDAIFPPRNVATAQEISVARVPLPPHPFQVLIWNDTNQNSSTSSVSVLAELYNETVA